MSWEAVSKVEISTKTLFLLTDSGKDIFVNFDILSKVSFLLFEKNFGLAGILSVNKRLKGKE